MSAYFLDTSAIVKLYIEERGTNALLDVVENAETLFILSLTPIEFRSAIRRRERAGEINGEHASNLLATFSSHLESRFVRQPLTESTIEQAAALIDRYTLRAYDAMQLAGYFSVRATNDSGTAFVCADAALIEAASGEGAAVIDPTR